MMKHIQDLVETKAFAALTEQERKMVLSEITEGEYTRLRHWIQQAKLSMQSEVLMPNAAVQQNLAAHFRAKHVKVNPLIQFLVLKIPIWAVIVGLLSLGYVFYYFSSEKTHQPAKPALQNGVEQIFVYLRDTIYLDRPMIATYADSSHRLNMDTPTTKHKNQPIARRKMVDEYLMEQPLTYYDTNAVSNIEHQIRGQKLEERMPAFEINVW
jgi:hypothetical protein